MNIELEVLSQSPESSQEWDRYVRSRSEGTFFHLSGWREAIKQAFGHGSYYISAKEGGRLMGILPLAHIKSRLFGNALISNGFGMGGGPIAANDSVYARLDEEAGRLRQELGAAYVEYRAPAKRHQNWAARDDLYANFARQLPQDEDEALKQIPRKQRAVVRKALKNETLTTRIDETIDDFYELYAISVRNLGTPVSRESTFAS